MRRDVAQGTCKHNLDLDEQASQWLANTPNKDAMDLLFYVTEVGHFRAFRNFFTDRRDKNEYYLLYTVSGRGLLKQHGQKIVLRAQDAVFIHCAAHQYYATASDEPWEHYWVHFNGIGAKSYYRIINDGEITCVHIDDAAAFTENLRGILGDCGAPDMRQSVVSSMRVTNLLTMMVMGKYAVHNMPTLTAHEGKLKGALAFIQANYDRPLSVAEIAEQAGLSPCYFGRLFRQYTGLTPHEYILNYRINQAKERLRTTAAPIAEIGAGVGFADPCNFSRTFRRIAGCTPNMYRRNRESDVSEANP